MTSLRQQHNEIPHFVRNDMLLFVKEAWEKVRRSRTFSHALSIMNGRHSEWSLSEMRNLTFIRLALFSHKHPTECHSGSSEPVSPPTRVSHFFSSKHFQSSSIRSFFIGALILLSFQTIAEQPDYRKTISQYGITWEFEKPMLTGQFVTGDWWVVGPAIIVKITPEPGPVRADNSSIKINRWGDTSLKQDTTMRNGSAVVIKAGHRQSYDSRAEAFDPDGSVKLPFELRTNLSLISSISNDTLPVYNFCKNILWEGEYFCQNVMKTAAVLTSLSEPPPADAFRPSYVGANKPIFRAGDIKWELLPRLSPAGEVPSWEEYERYFERPWLDHLLSWSQQELVPNENQPNYGREQARLVSTASLMLCLDVPQQQKEKLATRLIQRGIDLYGLAMNGGYWNEGGGHSSGRKWPILFASLMLDNPKMTELPETAFFQEDTQTYYGEGWFGQNVLWQMIMHHGKRDTYEEKPPEEWEKWDRTSEGYRVCCNAVAWTGTALAARYMKAIKLWGHDAHFDYVDRWMREDDPYKEARGNHPRPSGETKTFDPFVTEMWKAHRPQAPLQEMAGNPRKWVWQGNKGTWIPNEKVPEKYGPAYPVAQSGINNQRMDGYRGIWFELGQKYEFGDKYSGALGTYTSMHIPLAAYSEKAQKTFFVYGGTTEADKRYLLCMIGEYDHKTGKVSKPVVVHDKDGVDDPHDNPVILIDDEDYIWVFVSGRGARRPGYKYRSREPLNIIAFDRITEEEMTYPQPWKTKDGFLHLFTKYTGIRQLYFETSTDGVNWTEDRLLAAMPEKEGERSGHYQISSMHGKNKVGTFFNRHPDGNVDKRTDLYYVQTTDFARTWTTVDGKPLDIPMVNPDIPARVINYSVMGKNIYIRDMVFDDDGHPVCLYIRSNGHEPGPVSGPYEWCITRWKSLPRIFGGRKWVTHVITTSDHNYDMGSIYVSGKNMKLVAPTETSPQQWGVGGEVVLWESKNSGKTWKKVKNITENSRYNHSYVRRPVNYKEPFCFFWADGHPHEFSKSQLYFGDFEGNVWRLPYEMDEDYMKPEKIEWKQLFNGKNLDGWSVKCLPADEGKNFWSVENGTILCNSMHDSTHNYVWLMHEREFDDFELKLKFQAYRDSPGNSGVQVRSRFNQNSLAEGGFWLDGPQVDIDPTTQWRTGFIYDETWEEKRWIYPSLPDWRMDKSYAPEKVNFVFGNGDDLWNELVIICKGTRIQTFLNNNLVTDYDGDGILNSEAHLKRSVGMNGQIALQLHSNDRLKMRFKDIFVREIR